MSGPSNCPVAALSAETATPVTDVTWSRADETFTEEFRVDSDVAAENTTALADADPVLEVGDERVYQFSREAGPDATCACEVVESLGHPLADVRVEGGDLVLTLHLPGVERLQEVVSDLEAVADDVEMRYLVHAAADGEGRGDRTVVDRGRLTERQREVLATAYELGYFEYPREANATEVAEALDVGLSTFAEHLAAAQGKLLSETLAV
ncbi:helix-turn-helix domain-containing protein [Salinirubellus salinus]|uniref:Helix-turn-helix domain-containing protein n=1 Tax=Salinirubellus salinus TaxID=1364945 RepID=A0A9E7R2F1_9EURY|nr:helix-turn-helix domain-containing protein [Salinirubellus salinus]UWM54292.1 helix-turn-helix domain-containing protein [Salinirubellus salinus]